MKILFYDRVQDSNAPDKLKSRALADYYDALTSLTITLDDTYDINCIGVGYTDATQITVNGDIISTPNTTPANYKNGLYLLSSEITTDSLNISHNGTYLGRFAAGKYTFLCASPTREPGFATTKVPRMTVSGQMVDSAGGITYRKISLDFRYKFNESIITEIEAAYINQISGGFPLFLLFDKEDKKIHWDRLYAYIGTEFIFQSSINQYLYSKRFDLEERY